MLLSPLQRRLENLLVIVAALLIAGGLYAWSYRLVCIGGAVGVIALIAGLRFGGLSRRRRTSRTSDTYAVIARMRADRDARFARPGRRRP